MKDYHLVFKVNEEDFFSKGMNIKAENPKDAIIKWEEIFPTAIFFAIYITKN